MDIETTLRNIGLTDGETRVYLALVGLGSTTVGPIINKARISSSKVYIILEKLIQKGLVTYITKEKTKYFQAAPPIALMDYIEIQEKKIQKTKRGISEAIKEVEKLQSLKRGEEAKIYRGYSGLKTGIFEAVKTIPDKGEYYFFSVGYGEDPIMKRLFTQVMKELKRRNITIKGVAHIREKKLYEIYYKKIGYRMRFIDIKWPSDTVIIGDYYNILVWDKKEPVFYSIKSRILVDAYLKFFQELWKKGKK